jgi:hypothetical protein
MSYNKYNIEFFRDLAIKKEGNCLSEVYKNPRTKLLFVCKNKHEWLAQPRHILRGTWCPTCFRENQRIYKVDDGFFSKDSEQSFYVAGLLAADGWKTKRSGGYTVGISLKASDKDFLSKIKDIIKSEHSLIYAEHDNKNLLKMGSGKEYKIFSSYILAFCSKQIFNDLEKFCIVERKTYKLYIPDWLKSHSLVRHFLRGYIDGDGCFCKARNKGQGPHVSFSMRGTVSFLKSFYEILYKNNVVDIKERNREFKPMRGKKYKAFDKCCLSGNAVVSKLYDFLYKDATICLERKREIAELAKEWAIEGTDKPRKKPCNALPIYKDVLLQKARELKNQREIAKFFNCTPALISWHIAKLGIREEMRKAFCRFSKEEIISSYNEIGAIKTARKYNITKTRVYQILKENKKAA